MLGTIIAWLVIFLGVIILYYRHKSISDEDFDIPVSIKPKDKSESKIEPNQKEYSPEELPFIKERDDLQSQIEIISRCFLKGQVERFDVDLLEEKFQRYLEWLPTKDQIKSIEDLVPNTDNTPLERIVQKESTSVEQDYSHHYFISEIMLSAGPRKRFINAPTEADTDLGEDVAGLVQKGDYLFFWVLDGASNSSIIRTNSGADLFSSRHLAHSIGMHCGRICRNISEVGPLDSQSIAQQAIKNTALEWEEHFSSLEEQDKLQIESKLENGNQTCSTTMIFGTLHKDGTLNAIKIGDSVLLAFDHESQISNSKKGETSRVKKTSLFFRLDADTKKIQYNNPMKELTELHGVQMLIGATDGVGKSTLALLKTHLPKNEEELRQAISFLPQKTEDDKCLLIVRLNERY